MLTYASLHVHTGLLRELYLLKYYFWRNVRSRTGYWNPFWLTLSSHRWGWRWWGAIILAAEASRFFAAVLQQNPRGRGNHGRPMQHGEDDEQREEEDEHHASDSGPERRRRRRRSCHCQPTLVEKTFLIGRPKYTIVPDPFKTRTKDHL